MSSRIPILTNVRTRVFLGLIFLAAIVHPLSGQIQLGGTAPSGGSAEKVTVEAKSSMDKVSAGSSFQLAVFLDIEEGWHINGHRPSEDYLIGTSLELEPLEGVIISDIQYPPAKTLKFEFADEPLDVYEGTVPIFLTVKVSEKVAPGVYTLHGKLHLQACDNHVCLPPVTIAVDVPVEVVGSEESVSPINQDVFSSYIPSQSPTTAGSTDDIVRLLETEGTFVFFLTLFLVGLALNLTPCVYPMLTVTVSLFGAQQETRTTRVFVKAVIYVLGIASMYSVLGAAAGVGGGLFGSWLQSPWVLAAIAGLLFVLALSMFGVYQIQMPYWLTQKLGSTTTTGVIGLYFSGLVVGIFAAPCIGPPIIALLAVIGAKGDPVFGFWTFFVMSLGLGFPYLILGTFSGLLKKLPHSGVWLVWVERVFGVVLTGAAAFYLSLAFLPQYSAYAVPLTLLIGGIYLGFLEPSGKQSKTLRRIQWAFGVVVVGMGLVTAYALRQPSVEWDPYSETLLFEAKQQGKPVILDFYADWCIPCLELDRRTFTDPDVISATKPFVRLKVDLTHFDSPEAEALRKRYNIAGVPTIVFLNSSGEEVVGSRIVGFVPPKEFLARLQPVVAAR